VQLNINIVDHKINLTTEKLDRMDPTRLDFPQPHVLVVEYHPTMA
jgi:hypothetical protein